MLGARREFLADVAALLEIHAMEVVDTVLQKKALLDEDIAAAVGQAVTEA